MLPLPGGRDLKFLLTDEDAKAFPFRRIYDKAIAALNAGMKEPEDQNPEVRYTGGGFWFQPSVIRHELREWLLQSLQTLRTPWLEDHPDIPDKNIFRASGPLVDDNYASVGRSILKKCRIDSPTVAAAAGHEHLDSEFITTVMSVAELCLRDKDGTHLHAESARGRHREGLQSQVTSREASKPFEVIRQHVYIGARRIDQVMSICAYRSGQRAARDGSGFTITACARTSSRYSATRR